MLTRFLVVINPHLGHNPMTLIKSLKQKTTKKKTTKLQTYKIKKIKNFDY
jgi:hypothetical protein